MKKLIIPILAIMITSFYAVAQEKSPKELKGDKYAFSYAYDKAIEKYASVKQLTVEGQRNLAKSYQKMNRNVEAEITYAKLVNAQELIIAEDYYNYAMVLKVNGKLNESNTNMDKFVEQTPNDLRAKDYVANKENYTNLSTDNGNFKLLYLDVNTNDRDFGTAFYNDKIVFASTRSFPGIFKRTDNRSGKPFLNLYVSEIEGEQLKDPMLFEKNLKGRMHDGPASFSRKNTYMAYSSNNSKDKSTDKVVEVQIYFSSNIDGKWSDAVPFILNDKGYSVGHPSLLEDGNTMYFSSTMDGGFGGVDLYKITRNTDGAWGLPENLGNQINTEGDELFPFYEEISGNLFFSSNGRFGLGGLDVFICTKNGNKFNPPYNAGSPLNSMFDDFAVIVDNKMSKGYFTSNRTGTTSENDNIYSIEFFTPITEQQITGVAKDINENPVSQTIVLLNNEENETIETVVTNDSATFRFLVDKNKKYILIGKKEGYTDGKTIVNTFDIKSTLSADVIMIKKEERPVAAKTTVINEKGEKEEFHTIYFDFDKSTIRPDAVKHLAEVINFMKATPSAKLLLSGHCDSEGTSKYNVALSNRRNNAVIQYLKSKGISDDRIIAKGYGFTQLVNNCAIAVECSDAENQLNRRVEFKIKDEKNKKIVQQLNQKEYRVKEGNTLYSVSKAYNLTVKELKVMNKLSDEKVYVGQVLIVSK